LDDMDTFSNILFINGMHADLSYHAHRASTIDKYRPETCCAIGEPGPCVRAPLIWCQNPPSGSFSA
jgi:hypothetical protein